MKIRSVTCCSIIAVACGAAPVAAQAMQPKMAAFEDAFYTCDNHGSFEMSYDSEKPTKVTMTTSNGNTQYNLKRTAVSNGVEFSNAGTKFWTDNKSVVVSGTKTPFLNCKFKAP